MASQAALELVEQGRQRVGAAQVGVQATAAAETPTHQQPAAAVLRLQPGEVVEEGIAHVGHVAEGGDVCLDHGEPHAVAGGEAHRLQAVSASLDDQSALLAELTGFGAATLQVAGVLDGDLAAPQGLAPMDVTQGPVLVAGVEKLSDGAGAIGLVLGVAAGVAVQKGHLKAVIVG